MFKNSPSICYIFFAINDETVTGGRLSGWKLTR